MARWWPFRHKTPSQVAEELEEMRRLARAARDSANQTSSHAEELRQRLEAMAHREDLLRAMVPRREGTNGK